MSEHQLETSLKPKQRLVLTMHPYQPIEKEPNGNGGGIRLRVYGQTGEAHFLDVVWGHTTEIEVLVDNA